MAIIVLKEWRVKLVDNPKPLILYSDEDLANLDKLLMNSISIEPTGRCGLGTDGKNTYDGHPSRGLVRTSKGAVGKEGYEKKLWKKLEAEIEEAAAEAQAATVERCIDAMKRADGAYNPNAETLIRQLSPSPDPLARVRLEAKLEEAELTPHDDMSHIPGGKNTHCRKCARVADLEEQHAALGK